MPVAFHTSTLDNGLRILGEVNPHAHSVAVSFVVRTGARDEAPEEYGVSHFLEHMAFKGTTRRSAEDINREFDEIGAHYNAATSEETTSFWAAVLPEFLPRAVDLLADILQPALRDDDFTLEKEVILEEIHMYMDQPTWMLYDRAMELYFAGHYLGHSVLGTVQSIKALTVEQMRAYHRRHYRAGNVLVAVAGNFDWEELVALIQQHCGRWPAGRPERNTAPHAPRPLVRVFRDEKIQHAYLVGISPAPPLPHTLGLTADLLAASVGDSTGSRLFWELVDPGRADVAEFERHAFTDTGTFLAHVSCAPEGVVENVEAVLRICRDVEAHGVTEEELECVRRKLAARLVLAAERPLGRVGPLSSDWLYHGVYRPIDALLEELYRLSLDELRLLLRAYRPAPQAFIGLGPIPETELAKLLEAYSERPVPTSAD